MWAKSDISTSHFREGGNPEALRADYPLVAIVGPTASGKSSLAIAVARRRDGEIINFDAMQMYRGFDIGTGKLRPEQREGLPHHLLDCVEPGRLYSAGEFARNAGEVLEGVRERAKLPILVGGTGLYLRALVDGLFEGPKRSEALRARLLAIAERKGRAHLHRLLLRLDPAAAQRIAPRDTQKILRAIEVCILAGEPISRLHARGRNALQGFRVIKIGFDPERAELNQRIDARVVEMFRAGLVEEARGLFVGNSGCNSGPFTSLGYPQAHAVARGEISVEQAILETQSATRRYAKRQRTWFRHESGVTWFTGFGDDVTTQNKILAWLDETLRPPAVLSF